MKITIYELLGLVKDGKAPKHIKCNNLNLYWNDENYTYDIREDKLYVPFYMFDYSELNDEVEIIEEPKKIGKIARCDDVKMTHYDELYKPTENEEILRIKINELIDEINNLKKK